VNGPGQRDLREAVGVGAEEAHVAQLHRLPPADRADHARHRRRLAVAADDDGRRVHVDAVECDGEAVRVALRAHLAIGDDVDSRALHVADGDQGGVVLRALQRILRDAPDLLQPHARDDTVADEDVAVHQPGRLRVAADHRGRQQRLRGWHAASSP
jgi:hypothetical protein